MYLWTATGSPQTNDSERGITMKKIGAITVGQSPRVDLIPEIQPILGDSVEIIQAGAGRTFKGRDRKVCSASR